MTTDECIALSDDELVEAAYAVVDDLTHSNDEQAAHAGGSLIFLLGELLERFAPEDENELLDALDGLRRRQATRMLRDALRPQA